MSARLPEGAERLRLASWNVRSGWALDRASFWPLRRSRVAEVLARIDADLWGLQEVFWFQRRWLLRHGLPAGRWAHAGDGRGRCRRGEAVPIVWRRERLQAHGHATRWFGPTPDRPGSRGRQAGAPRVATWVDLAWAGRRVVVVNAHLDDRSAEARHEAAVQVADAVGRAAEMPHVVMGDFNATLDDDELQPLLAAGLRSALPAAAGPTATAFEREEGRRLDHVLVSSHWAVVSAEVATGAGRASDHYPVVADLELR